MLSHDCTSHVDCTHSCSENVSHNAKKINIFSYAGQFHEIRHSCTAGLKMAVKRSEMEFPQNIKLGHPKIMVLNFSYDVELPKKLSRVLPFDEARISIVWVKRAQRCPPEKQEEINARKPIRWSCKMKTMSNSI